MNELGRQFARRFHPGDSGGADPQLSRLRRRTTVVILVLLLLGLTMAVTAVVVSRAGSSLTLGQRCGAVESGEPGIPTPPAVVRTEITCFAHAYTHCSAASLDYRQHGLDTLFQGTFVVVPGSKSACGLVLQWTNDVDAGIIKRSGQEHCTGLTQGDSALTFHSCGTWGDIQVPPIRSPAP
jgi:hypothetical protein